MIFFYIFKTLSDISLSLSIIPKQDKILWINFKLFGYKIRHKDFFHSNVDPYTGLHLIFFVYFFFAYGFFIRKYSY